MTAGFVQVSGFNASQTVYSWEDSNKQERHIPKYIQNRVDFCPKFQFFHFFFKTENITNLLRYM